MSTPGQEQPLVFSYAPVADGGKPVVPLLLSTTVRSVLIVATLAPSLPRTVISPVWAAAIDLSPGQTAVAQILREFGHAAEPWGPQVIVVPQLAPELDETAWPEPAFDENREQEARDWRELDACLLGHDFLRNVSAMLIGQRGLLALFDFEPPPQAA